jgi:phosphoribosylformylglycinamidine (FGAM) synthase-like enzyme
VADPGDVIPGTFSGAGQAILLLGATSPGSLGGSEWVVRHTGKVQGPPPVLDLGLEVKLQGLLLALCRARPRLLESAHDVSDGGFGTCLAECVVAGDDERAMVGARVTLPGTGTLAERLFAEGPSRVVVSVREQYVAQVIAEAEKRGVPAFQIGTTGGPSLVVEDGGKVLVDVDAQALRAAREACLDGIVGA